MSTQIYCSKSPSHPICQMHVPQLGSSMGTKMIKPYSFPSGKHRLVEVTERSQTILLGGGCIWYSIRRAEDHTSVWEGKSN